MGDSADPRAQERVGSVLNGKWTLEHLIGSGGMGAVYAARHRNGARAAVKILHPELARFADVRERFLREGYAANRVDHRGVVGVLDDDVVQRGPDEGSAYLVMELLEGESLQDRARRDPKLGERELLEVMDAVLDVLTAAHHRGVIHRDLKPENIFLAKDPEHHGVRVKVLDFGLARIAEAAAVTRAGIAVGTPSFMSPEQAAGRSEEIDGRTDLFALGATIFRVVTGRRIHDAENMVQLVVLMATIPAPRLRSIMPDVSEGFAHVIDRALAFDKADRYPDAATMQAHVRAAIELCARGPATSLEVVPFSARNVRAAPLSEIASPSPAAPPPDKADAIALGPPTEQAAAFFTDKDKESSASRARTAPTRAIARSAMVPWALVLLLLGLGAWKLGPSLRDKLGRSASVEPIEHLSSTSTAAAEPPVTSAEGEPSAKPPVDELAEPEHAPVPTPAAPSETAQGDAGAAPAATPLRPRSPIKPQATKPPAKKPAAKKTR